MWHLEKLSNDTVKWFTDTFLQPVYDNIQRAGNGLPTQVKRKLTKEVIKNLMEKEPETLYSYADRIKGEIIATGVDWNIVRPKLFALFDYDNKISKNKELSYELADKVGTKTCVYCNRIYTITAHVYEDEDGNALDDASKRRIVRPDFDHWLAKAKHPLTSMSIYNLIPSCPICNRSIKLRKEFERGNHVHPYTSAVEPSFKFHYEPAVNGQWNLSLDGGSDIEKRTAEILETEAVYKCHADMEVKDILDFLYSNTPEYLNDLFNKVLGANGGMITTEEAYKIIFGFEALPAKFLDRPLSKLKRDILMQAAGTLHLSFDSLM